MEVKDPLMPLNIVIGDRNYRVKVAASNEESVRRTIKIINEKIIEFKTQFAGKDMQDYVAMVLVWYATQTKNGEGLSAGIETQQLLAELEKLDLKIQKALD